MSESGPGSRGAEGEGPSSGGSGGSVPSPESSTRASLAAEMPFAASRGASSGWAEAPERSISPELRSPRDSQGSGSNRPRRSDSFNLSRSIPIPEDSDMPTGFGADIIIPGPSIDSPGDSHGEVSMPLSAGANETDAIRHRRARSEEPSAADPMHPPGPQSMRIERSRTLDVNASPPSPASSLEHPGNNGPKSLGYAGASKAKPKGDGKDSLRKLFKLPDDEVLIEEYLCALYKKILLQGRMYLFRNYVCFYSNVFGYQKNKVIPLKDVTIVRRAYTVKVVPNAIEIVRNGKCEFFTSFIFPDRAYRNITNAWKECSQYAKIFAAADVDNSSVSTERLSAPRFTSPPSAEVAAMLGLGANDEDKNDDDDDGDTDDFGPSSTGPRSSGSTGPRSVGEDKETLLQRRRRRKSSVGDAPGVGATGGGSGPGSAGSQSTTTVLQPEGSDGSPATGPDSSSGPTSVGSTGLRKRRSVSRSVTSPAGLALDMAPGEAEAPDYSDEDEDDEDEDAGSDADIAEDFGETLLTTDTPVPPRPSDMRTLEECVLECSVDDVFSLVWSDSARAAFGAEDHASRGETAVQTTEWSRHRHHGHARDLTFIAPVNASIGPKQTNCHQTQSYHVCRGGVLVVDTSQVQTDIPYGDYFRVETRWEIAPAPPYRRRLDGCVVNRCTVWIGLRIPFHRSTMLRRVIEQSVVDESKKSSAGTIQLLVDILRRQDEAARSRAAAVEAPSPREALDRLSDLAGPGEEDPIDASKLNIPDDSFDVISRMLFGGAKKTTPTDDASSSPAALTVGLARGSGDSSSAGMRSALTSPSGTMISPGSADYNISPKYYAGSARGAVRSWLARGGLLGGPGFALVAAALLCGFLAVAWSVVGFVWGVSTGAGGGLGPGRGNDVEFWQRRAAQLERELSALERRVAFVAGEVSHANRALAEAANDL